MVPCFVPRAGQPSEGEGGEIGGGGGGGGGGDSEPVLVLNAQLVLHWLITTTLRCGLSLKQVITFSPFHFLSCSVPEVVVWSGREQ